MRLLLFVLLEVLFLPFQLVGTLIFAFRVRFVNMRRGVSGTAYEPYMARLILQMIGERPDVVAERIGPHLPALPPVVMGLLMKTVAVAVRRSGFRGGFLAWPGPCPSTLLTFISHRTDFFDQAVADAAGDSSPVRQVVFLGAGGDTRAYGRLADAAADAATPGLRIFEVDQPPTQQAKIRALRDAGVACDHVTFAPTDFNQRSWMDSLVEHGFDPELPTFVLWEGVTMYLDDETVAATLARVASLAPGSCIAFDFLSRELVFGRRPYLLLGNYAKYAMGAFYGESWHFGLSTAAPARQQVLDFFDGLGLEVETFEPLGRESARAAPIGGVVLARRSEDSMPGG